MHLRNQITVFFTRSTRIMRNLPFKRAPCNHKKKLKIIMFTWTLYGIKNLFNYNLELATALDWRRFSSGNLIM